MIGEQTAKQYVKQAVFALACVSVGFYLGGRYVGMKAYTVDPTKPTFGLNSTTTHPDWIEPAQAMLQQSLIVFTVCVFGWIALDYLWSENE
jgi:hypothetical protein